SKKEFQRCVESLSLDDASSANAMELYDAYVTASDAVRAAREKQQRNMAEEFSAAATEADQGLVTARRTKATWEDVKKLEQIEQSLFDALRALAPANMPQQKLDRLEHLRRRFTMLPTGELHVSKVDVEMTAAPYLALDSEPQRHVLAEYQLALDPLLR